jgi:phage terminase small subunit
MAGKAAGGEGSETHGLVLVGTDKGQLRKGSERNWSDAKEREFLSVLAATCNVTQAATEAGVSVSHAYRRRKGNAAFRAAWLEAIGAAYQRLELVLLERAFNGTEKVIRRKDGSEERMLEYSNQLGLALLKMHRDTAAEASTEIPAADVDEIRERILKKLQRLRKRNEQEDAAAE